MEYSFLFYIWISRSIYATQIAWLYCPIKGISHSIIKLPTVVSWVSLFFATCPNSSVPYTESAVKRKVCRLKKSLQFETIIYLANRNVSNIAWMYSCTSNKLKWIQHSGCTLMLMHTSGKSNASNAVMRQATNQNTSNTVLYVCQMNFKHITNWVDIHNTDSDELCCVYIWQCYVNGYLFIWQVVYEVLQHIFTYTKKASFMMEGNRAVPRRNPQRSAGCWR